MRNLLITGGAGFIGSNFTRYWMKNNPDDIITVFDKLTYAGTESNFIDLSKNSNFNFVKGDISNYELIFETLKKFKITHLINFAAESHVDRSIRTPLSFIETNVLGTYILLQGFKDYWNENGKPACFLFHHVSTDEVYGSLGIDDDSFDEQTSYNPRSPYSASKASSDHLVKAWHHTYDLPIQISNCSNNYGPFHFPEKLVPKTIINIIMGKEIPLYGDGENIRDWIYVEDHCKALSLIIKNPKIGQTFCIGGSNEISNKELINMICDLNDELSSSHPIRPSRQLIKFVKDRKGHDFRYSINSSKLKTNYDWKCVFSLEDGLRETINWYLNNVAWWDPLLNKQ